MTTIQPATSEPMAGPPAIVTVVRDDLPGLLATWESLRQQHDRSFLWIVMDGASQDGTAKWLASRNGDVAWWRSAPDRGPYDAMNIGLSQAQRLGAGYVLFLNAGDLLNGAESVGRLRNAAAANPSAPFLYGDSLERLPDGDIVLKPARSHGTAIMGMFTHHQAILYRCDAIGDLRFDLRFRIAADYAFTLAIQIGAATSPVRLDFPVCTFAPAGLSARETKLGRQEQRMIRRDLLRIGRLVNTAVSALQRVSWTVRFLSPKIYKELRFGKNATKFLSLPINHNQ